MQNMQCLWQKCKFNKNCSCEKTSELFPASHSHPLYEKEWNKNSQEIKENCRCLTFDIAQYKKAHEEYCKRNESKMTLEEWYFTFINKNEPTLLATVISKKVLG